MRMNVFDAGALIDKAYKNKLGSKVQHKVDVAGVQAFLSERWDTGDPWHQREERLDRI